MNINELKLGTLTIEGASEILKTFDLNFKSVGLSTLDSKKRPVSSYAAFIKEDEVYYIMISQTAPHYDNIVNNNTVGIIFLEDESTSLNTFFRKRLAYSCKANLIKDESLIKSFAKEHGPLANMLLTNMDFDIFKLDIEDGKLILGAGKAFFINKENVITHQDTGKAGHLKK